MKIKNKAKHILSAALSAVVLLGSMPTLTYAAQVNEYVDPADIWVSANGRTNELDFNATITQETGWCPVCNKDTIMLTYRTPEYTIMRLDNDTFTNRIKSRFLGSRQTTMY